MKILSRYQQGQRWEFKTNVAEFERSLVIGRVMKPHPEWGPGWNETRYEVYVRYSALREMLIQSIPPDYDGVVLSLTAEGLDRSVTKLVESGVELPWWWVYGRRFASESDVKGRQNVTNCDRVSEPLPGLFSSALQTAGWARQRATALERHQADFKPGTAPPPPSNSVAESWARIVAWMAEHAPLHKFVLNPGASETAITAFEEAIGVKLPDDFKESLRIHDGSDCVLCNCWIPPNYGDFLSLELILQQWKMYKGWQEDEIAGVRYAGPDWIPLEIKGPIKPIFWNVKRIYITDNSGDHLTLDLDPPEDGTYGQILDHSHEVGPTHVVAPSWSEFLRQLVDDLESGKYVYFEETGELEHIDSFNRGY